MQWMWGNIFFIRYNKFYNKRPVASVWLQSLNIWIGLDQLRLTVASFWRKNGTQMDFKTLTTTMHQQHTHTWWQGSPLSIPLPFDTPIPFNILPLPFLTSPFPSTSLTSTSPFPQYPAPLQHPLLDISLPFNPPSLQPPLSLTPPSL